MIRPFNPAEPTPEHDICVVGAGPVGLALALRAAAGGSNVLMLEAGGMRPSRRRIPADRIDPERHAPLQIAAAQALGGTSHWWGGRCVPFDPVDFRERPWVAIAGWPIALEDVAPWVGPAAGFLGCGPPQFVRGAAGWDDLGPVRFEELERWAPEICMAHRHHQALAADPRIQVRLGAHVVGLELSPDGARVETLNVRADAALVQICPKRVVLAGGGVETTRVLLASQRKHPRAFGGEDGTLGRFYMGHISGKIADLILTDAGDSSLHDFLLDEGVYVRRRLTLSAKAMAAHALLNVAFWADNPRFFDARHENSVLSLVWLALATPGVGARLLSEGVRRNHLGPRPRRVAPHLANVLRRPGTALGQVLRVISARYAQHPARPGFLLASQSGRYALHYHAEQAPNPDSRIRLIDGVVAEPPALVIDLQYSAEDVASVIRAHEVLDAGLRQGGVARLEYHSPVDERAEAVHAQATDGFHQIGTTRMSDHPADGVVDRNLRVHGLDNLYVASSSVFPTSGQANPTLLAVTLGMRLADHLTSLSPDGTLQ